MRALPRLLAAVAVLERAACLHLFGAPLEDYEPGRFVHLRTLSTRASTSTAVHRDRRSATPALVVIKRLAPAPDEDRRLVRMARAALRSELRIHNRVGRDPNVLRPLEAFVDPKTNASVVLVFPHISGGDLRKQTLAPCEATGAIAQLASGLAALQAHGVAHRDVHHGNVLVAEGGGGGFGGGGGGRARRRPPKPVDVKLADFGLASIVEGQGGFAAAEDATKDYYDLAFLALKALGCRGAPRYPRPRRRHCRALPHAAASSASGPNDLGTFHAHFEAWCPDPQTAASTLRLPPLEQEEARRRGVALAKRMLLNSFEHERRLGPMALCDASRAANVSSSLAAEWRDAAATCWSKLYPWPIEINYLYDPYLSRLPMRR